MHKRLRYAIFSLIPLGLTLLAIEIGVRLLEEEEIIDTTTADDAVHYVYDDLFEREGDWVRTTRYAEENMVPGRFRAEKDPDGWRVMLIGGSFAMGSPFVHANEGWEVAGGITSWLRAALHARYPGRPAEVVNLGAGGQDSNRVRDIAIKSLRQKPDVLVIATCNNEGFLPPGAVSRHLRQLGGYRLLVQLLKPTPADGERPLHTLQHPDVEAIERAHRENLEAIRDAAERRGVRVLFATLPVNLRYEGTNSIHQIGRAQREDDPCVEAGRARYESGDYRGAVEVLGACEDIPEALRWTGLAQIALGDEAAARAALGAAIELAPYNRCRPSFNQNIRDVAAGGGRVALVDLETRAIAESPSGFPGEDLFVDYCHMTREGYGLMADEVLSALEREGWLPAWPVDEGGEAAWRAAVGSQGIQALEPVHAELTWRPEPRSPLPNHAGPGHIGGGDGAPGGPPPGGGPGAPR